MPPRTVSVVGAIIVSVVILVTFGIVMFLVVTTAIPPANAPIANAMVGFLGAMASAVVGYWIGSTVGSHNKDSMLADAQDALANSMPVPLDQRTERHHEGDPPCQ
jgi:uncharacterized membrane protein YhhN